LNELHVRHHVDVNLAEGGLGVFFLHNVATCLYQIEAVDGQTVEVARREQQYATQEIKKSCLFHFAWDIFGFSHFLISSISHFLIFPFDALELEKVAGCGAF
jgi:hypothetical protein